MADTVEIRSKTYALFKEAHADIWRDILETFEEVEVWAANHTVGQRKRDFAKAVAKMRQLVSAYIMSVAQPTNHPLSATTSRCDTTSPQHS